jgi:hypothetical protein
VAAEWAADPPMTPTSRDLSSPGEIWLGDTYFPITGPVRLTNISVTPNPVIFGDSGKQGDTQVMSQFIQSRAIGGSGIHKGNVRTDFERSWKSRAETRWNYLTLPPLAVSMGLPSGVVVDPEVMMEFGNILLVAFGSDVYSWNEGSGVWNSLEQSLDATPVAWTIYKSVLYVATGGMLWTRDAGGVWASTAVSSLCLAVYDGKLWRLGSDGSGTWQIFYTVDNVTWTDGGKIGESDITPGTLLLYRNSAGDLALYLTADRGVWVYDDSSGTWAASDIQWPREVKAGVDTVTFRDGRLYAKTGSLGLVAIQSGNPMVAQPVGLDRDDGVPAEDLSTIAALTADNNWIVAMLDGSVDTGDLEYEAISGLGGPWVSDGWPTYKGVSTLRAYSGGWHCLWESPSDAYPGKCVFMSQAYSLKRLYWGANRQVYYMDLPTGIYNPRMNPTRKFSPGPVSHITPWWDFGTEVQEKLIPHWNIYLSGASSDEKVDVYYGTNLDDNTWTYHSTVTSNGLTKLLLNSGQGEQARFWRWRLDLSRGTDETKRPIVEYFGPEFMRLLPATYAFAATVSLTSTHRGQSPNQMLRALKRLADPSQTPGLVEFAYQDDLDGEAQTYLAKITRMAGQEETGRTLRGQGSYLVSIIAPYSEDAV